MGKKIDIDIEKLSITPMTPQDKELFNRSRQTNSVSAKIANMFATTKIKEPKIEIPNFSKEQLRSLSTTVNTILKKMGKSIRTKGIFDSENGKAILTVKADNEKDEWKLIPIFLMVNNMNEKDYFEKLGYDLANGYDNVGWMRVTRNEIQQYKTMPREDIRDEVEQWTQTEQWNYQVVIKIEEYLKPKQLDNDKHLEKFAELQDYVINGYIEGIHTLINRMWL